MFSTKFAHILSKTYLTIVVVGGLFEVYWHAEYTYFSIRIILRIQQPIFLQPLRILLMLRGCEVKGNMSCACVLLSFKVLIGEKKINLFKISDDTLNFSSQTPEI